MSCAPGPQPELTLRAVLAGCALGAVLAAANVYTDLKTASIDGGNITSSVLAFAAFRGAGVRYSALENNLTQTIAGSAAIMSMVSGVAGPVAALSLSGYSYPAWAVTAWGLALGVLGILIAVVLRQRLIVSDALPFPTGTATAEVISAMALGGGTATRRARVLLASAVFAALFTWFRDGPNAWLAQAWLVPGAVAGISAVSLSLGVSLSPLMFATGLMIGLRAGASMLLGSLFAWALVAPILIRSGIVASADYGELVNWLLWPGAALVLSSSLTSLALQWRSFGRGLRDLSGLVFGRVARGAGARPAAPTLALAALTLATVAGVVGLGLLVFELRPVTSLCALALAFVLATVCARSAGETDIAPVGSMGGVTQIIFGGTSQVSSLVCGSIVAGSSAQTASTLWALKAGHRLGASVKHQVLGQLIGALVGGLTVVPTYAVITRAYELGSERMPAPGALSWKATADAVQGGLGALPSQAPLAAGVALGVGCALTLLAQTRAARFLPSPVALGIAFLLPTSISAAMFLGAVTLTVVARRFPALCDEYVASLAGGAIAGESLLAVTLAALIASGVLGG